jgi:hypothetical protein
MSVAENVVERIEDAGGELGLNGERIRVRLPEDAVHLLEELRAHKDGVLSLLRRREAISAMPPGVRLVHWEPKPAPVVLTQYSCVKHVGRFVRMTLLELKAALASKRWQSGHRSPRELVDRLEQCGVRLEIEEKNLSFNNLPVRPGKENL